MALKGRCPQCGDIYTEHSSRDAASCAAETIVLLKSLLRKGLNYSGLDLTYDEALEMDEWRRKVREALDGSPS